MDQDTTNQIAALRREMQNGFERTHARIQSVHDELCDLEHNHAETLGIAQAAAAAPTATPTYLIKPPRLSAKIWDGVALVAFILGALAASGVFDSIILSSGVAVGPAMMLIARYLDRASQDADQDD